MNIMKKLNKEFNYREYKFNTSVEINTRDEKRLNGKVWHTIITNCMDGTNYYQKEEIETYQIEEYVEKHQQSAIDYVNKLTYNKSQNFEEQLLTGLGFK